MKKISMFILTAAIAAAAFAGCGSEAPAESNPESDVQVQSTAADTSTKSLSDIVTVIEQSNPVANARAIDDNYVQLDMLLTADNILEYSGKVSNDQGNSAMILAIKAVEGKAADVKAELEAYKANISSGGMYAEFAAMEEMAKDARIVEKGDYLVMVVANTQGADYAQIDTALDSALK